MEESYIRLIFGLKLRQIRNDRNISLFALAKKTSLSKSYLNEIEKGKKYPKTDKIIAIAEALEVPYDQLVSLKLDKNLAPVGEILQSKLLKEIPLEWFGIRESDLIDIIADAPLKVNTFISTMIEIAKHYNLTRESFYLAALRSYQEAHNNFFEDLEQAAEKFMQAYQIDLTTKLQPDVLEEILIEEYGYTINNDELSQHDTLLNLRSVFVPETKTLLIAKDTEASQRLFIYAKEIAYHYLNITDRLYTFSWIKFERFDQVLHNFYASYFAGALLIPRRKLVADLKDFFANPTFQLDAFGQLMSKYTDSAETFFQRLTNILPKDFNLKNVFFLRFGYQPQRAEFRLTKELHITQLLDPHANELNEHYCRRWVSVKSIFKQIQSDDAFALEAQISSYHHTENTYFVLSAAQKDPFRQGYFRSVSLGIMMSPHAVQRIPFLKDPELPKVHVGVTCETCAILDCKERVAPPKTLARQERYAATEEKVNELFVKFGKAATKS